jgi:predicted permease
MLGQAASSILTFAAIVGIGALLRFTGALRPEDARPLNSVILYVGLPAFIFRALHRAELGPELWRVVAAAWLVFAVVLALAWLASAFLRLERPRRGGFLLTTMLGNTGYIGYPMTAALLGAAFVPLAVFYDVFETVIALVLVGLPIAERMGTNDEARRHWLRELLTFPAVIAAIVGLAARAVPIPEVFNSGLDLLASLVAPLIMISVGLALRPRVLARFAVPLAVVVALRLVAAPLVAWAVGGAMVGGDVLRVVVLQAGMPSMMLSLVVGERYGLDTDFIASAIFVTTVAAALTVPLLQLVVG